MGRGALEEYRGGLRQGEWSVWHRERTARSGEGGMARMLRAQLMRSRRTWEVGRRALGGGEVARRADPCA